MKLASRHLQHFCAVVLVLAGCGSAAPPPSGEPDARGARGVISPDGLPADAPGTSVTANDAARTPDLAADLRPDRVIEPPDAIVDAGPMVSPRNCSAGHTCSGNARCQRACIGGLIYRCSCAEGHFVCTGCISIDGGAPDVRGGPGPCAAGVSSQRRCDMAGAVCQQRTDGAQKLCACGDLGPDRLWVCQ
jgi:hypothetical protein